MASSGPPSYDAVVLGGGFYGAIIAIYLARQRGLRRVALLEREARLFTRASYNNQARVHNGYHYPRSFTTAYRSRINYPRFVAEWPTAVKRDFTQLYAVARNNSKVTARQFERFCRAIGAKLTPAEKNIRTLFDPQLIEQVYAVEESAFDAVKLAAWVEGELHRTGVEVRLSTRAHAVEREAAGRLRVAADGADLSARYVFNCTYSGLNQIGGAFAGTQAHLKHEFTELALIEAPVALESLGVTVIDGPFFSLMPFPAQGLQTLSHVRYTPHCNRADRPGVDPYAGLDAYEKETRVERMIRDAARYLPAMRDARAVSSLFEVKTVLVKSEGDDGRPILFERSDALPNFYSILGGKIDNVYDVLEELESETILAA